MDMCEANNKASIGGLVTSASLLESVGLKLDPLWLGCQFNISL